MAKVIEGRWDIPTRTRVAAFRVTGVPRPKGSLRWYGPGKAVEDTKDLKPWFREVENVARRWRLAREGQPGAAWPFPGPVEVRLVFVFRREEGNAPEPVEHQRGDVDKLTRCILDGLVKAKIILDDSWVVRIVAEKCYAEVGLPGVEVELLAL